MRSRSATRSLRAAPFASLWVSIGSLMIEPTVIRGSSDPYGSWKMICMRRRIRRNSFALQATEVDAVETDRALRRLAQADHRPPGRALAAAGLADQPERLALAYLEADPVHGLDGADLGLEDARPDREVDLEILDLDEVLLRLRGSGSGFGQRDGHAIHPSG